MKRTTRLAEAAGDRRRPAASARPPRVDEAHETAAALDLAGEEERNRDRWGADEGGGPAAPAEEAEPDNGNSPDDALGLYLRQMGAIPLLNRDQELTLARRLERLRGRFRRAALSNWDALGKVVELSGGCRPVRCRWTR